MEINFRNFPNFILFPAINDFQNFIIEPAVATALPKSFKIHKNRVGKSLQILKNIFFRISMTTYYVFTFAVN
jgi:hypothetical protein